MKPAIWRRLAVAGLALLLLGAAVLWRGVRAGPAPALPPPGMLASATLVNDEAPLPAFALRRSGTAFTNADLLGHWTLMFFGYTYCPDVCPTTMAVVKELARRVSAAGIAPPAVVFVSVDAPRDTPEQLASFVRFFDPAFVGVVGDDTALAPLAKNLGVRYQRVDGPDKTRYTIDHSAAIYLIDPRGRLKAVFSWPQDAAAMAVDYPKIVAGN